MGSCGSLLCKELRALTVEYKMKKKKREIKRNIPVK